MRLTCGIVPRSIGELNDVNTAVGSRTHLVNTLLCPFLTHCDSTRMAADASIDIECVWAVVKQPLSREADDSPSHPIFRPLSPIISQWLRPRPEFTLIAIEKYRMLERVSIALSICHPVSKPKGVHHG